MYTVQAQDIDQCAGSDEGISFINKFCTYAPRLDISLKKNPTTFKFAHDLPVAVFYAMVFAKKYFPTGSIFFRIYKLHLYFFRKKAV